jgi:tRNA G26 N,N-dimethylase Trm1
MVSRAKGSSAMAIGRKRKHSYRYNLHHMQHYACFDCRKTFRREVDLSRNPCPDCGGWMHHMGSYFEAPRRRDVKAWRVIEVLVEQKMNWPRTELFPTTMRELHDLKLYQDSEREAIKRIRR